MATLPDTDPLVQIRFNQEILYSNINQFRSKCNTQIDKMLQEFDSCFYERTNVQFMRLRQQIQARKLFVLYEDSLGCDTETDYLIPKSVLPLFEDVICNAQMQLQSSGWVFLKRHILDLIDQQLQNYADDRDYSLKLIDQMREENLQLELEMRYQRLVNRQLMDKILSDQQRAAVKFISQFERKGREKLIDVAQFKPSHERITYDKKFEELTSKIEGFFKTIGEAQEDDKEEQKLEEERRIAADAELQEGYMKFIKGTDHKATCLEYPSESSEDEFPPNFDLYKQAAEAMEVTLNKLLVKSGLDNFQIHLPTDPSQIQKFHAVLANTKLKIESLTKSVIKQVDTAAQTDGFEIRADLNLFGGQNLNVFSEIKQSNGPPADLNQVLQDNKLPILKGVFKSKSSRDQHPEFEDKKLDVLVKTYEKQINRKKPQIREQPIIHSSPRIDNKCVKVINLQQLIAKTQARADDDISDAEQELRNDIKRDQMLILQQFIRDTIGIDPVLPPFILQKQLKIGFKTLMQKCIEGIDVYVRQIAENAARLTMINQIRPKLKNLQSKKNARSQGGFTTFEQVSFISALISTNDFLIEWGQSNLIPIVDTEEELNNIVQEQVETITGEATAIRANFLDRVQKRGIYE